MKNKIVTLAMLCSCFLCFCQQKITWEDLSKVTYTDTYLSKYDDYFMYPKFGPSVKALEGKLITIKGYFLDIDATGTLYILSKGPMASCFFCGVGGPETAVEIKFKNKPNFKTDDIITITGLLKLNKDDVEHFNYILTAATGKLTN